MTYRFRSSFVWGLLGCLGLGMALVTDAAADADRRAVVKRSRALLAEARESFAAGESDTALARLDSVLIEDPANPDAFYFRGLIQLSHADTAGAEDALSEGVRLAPLSRRMKLLLALVWVESGKLVEAGELVDEVSALRPHDLDALYLKGRIALAKADTLAAVEIWDSALSGELGVGEQ